MLNIPFLLSMALRYHFECQNTQRPHTPRQGWERLCGAGQAEFFVPVAGARSARDHGAGFTKTGLARAAFERTARRAPRERAAGQAEGEGRRLT